MFYQGKTNMIIGASGTGKSVLLKCMIGILTPEQGKVLYDGRDFVKADQDTVKAIRREMGVLFQGGALFDSKTVLENVRFLGADNWVTFLFIKNQLFEILKKFFLICVLKLNYVNSKLSKRLTLLQPIQ